MSNPIFVDIRKRLLSHATGDVLEIGIGSGLNLPLYPKSLKTLTAVDKNVGFDSLIQQRIASSKITVKHIVADTENLPFPDGTFDCVITTWTLCSIKNLDRALREIRRVLKPDGKLLFVEHGLSDNRTTQKIQSIVTPFWKMYKGGCHLDRNIKSLVEHNGFALDEYQEYDLPSAKRITRHTYEGVATKTPIMSVAE